MKTLDELLQRIVSDAENRGVYLREPLPVEDIKAQARAIRNDFGIDVPEDYKRLLRLTNGIQTQRGDLAALDEIRLQNFDIWEMDIEPTSDAEGSFVLQYRPRKSPPPIEYLWLGYAGNHSEQIYDVATGEFHQRGLGCGAIPDNGDRTLFGLLRFMIYRE